MQEAPMPREYHLPEGVPHRALCSLPLPDQAAARLVFKLWRDSVPVQKLKSNTFTNQQFSSICNDFPKLVSIDLGGSEALTASSLCPLSRLSKLTALRLSGCTGMNAVGKNADYLAGLEGLTGLQRLDLSYMGKIFMETPSECIDNGLMRMRYLQGLTSLSMSGNVRVTLYGKGNQHLYLQELTTLRCLCLGGTMEYNELSCQRPSLSFIVQALPYLSEVDLSRANLRRHPLRAFQKHKVLQALKLSHTINENSLSGLENLPSLTSLDVSFKTHVGNPCLKRLPAVKTLRFNMSSEHSLTDLTSLTELTSLRELALFPCYIEELLNAEMCSELLQLPQLRVLEICGDIMPVGWIKADLPSRLLTHPGLTRLSWTHLYASDCQLQAQAERAWKLQATWLNLHAREAQQGWVIKSVQEELVCERLRVQR